MGAFVPLLRHYTGDGPSDPGPAPLIDEPEPEEPPIDLEAELAAAYDRGRLDAEQAHAPIVAALEARLAASVPALEAVAQARTAALRRAGDDVAALVVGLARRVVGDAITVHPDALRQIVVDALGRLPDEDDLWVRVAPPLVEPVRSLVPERYRERVSADPEVGPGCVVETRHVAIDATLDAVIEGVEDATRAWLAGRP